MEIHFTAHLKWNWWRYLSGCLRPSPHVSQYLTFFLFSLFWPFFYAITMFYVTENWAFGKVLPWWRFFKICLPCITLYQWNWAFRKRWPYDLMTSNLCMAIQGNLVFNHYWTLQRHKDILSPILFSPHRHPWFNVHLLWTLEMAPLHKNLNMLQMFHLTTPTGLALLSELFPLFVSSPMEGHIVL